MNVSFYITIIWRHLLIDILLLLYMGDAEVLRPVSTWGPASLKPRLAWERILKGLNIDWTLGRSYCLARVSMTSICNSVFMATVVSVP